MPRPSRLSGDLICQLLLRVRTMDDTSNKLKQTRENLPKKCFVPVKSRYLDFKKKCPSQSENSGSTIRTGSGAVGATASPVHVQKPEKVSKTSTPTKDVSLFLADVSAVSLGNGHKARKYKDDPAELSERVFQEYNKALLLEAMNLLLERQHDEFTKSADNQLAVLQNAVAQSACTLDNRDLQIHVSTSLDELQNNLEISQQVINETVGDPVFLDSKNFEDVTAQLNEVSNQLPCKNVRIPSTKEDLDDIENVALTLSDKLSNCFLQHGNEIHLVSRIKEKLSVVDSTCYKLSEANASIEELMPIATTKVLDETSKSIKNSTLANMDIKF